MIVSMTGFASRVFSFKNQNYRLEVKSLNHRFLDLKLRMPREWSSLEIWIRKQAEGAVKRGSVDLQIERILSEDSVTSIDLDIELAVQAYSKIQELRKRTGLDSEVQIRDLITFPDVVGKGRGVTLTPHEIENLRSVLESELKQLFQTHFEMKQAEGAFLEKTLRKNIDALESFQKHATSRRVDLQQTIQEKRTLKIKQCFEAYPLPHEQMKAILESRLAQEISMILDRTDIEEELQRLEGHIKHFRDTLNASEGVGKKLDFLCQELHREVTTLGNKAQDMDLSENVVQAKVWVEQLREQVANVE